MVEENIESFFHNVNKDLIKYSNGYIEDLVVLIDSLDCGNLNIAPLAYGVTKMSFLYNSYVDSKRLKEFYKLSVTSKKLSIVFDFKAEQGCLKSLVLTRDKTSGPFTRAKVFFRTVDLSKKVVPDLFLIKFILEKCPNYRHELLTLFISHGFLLPAAVANTYDVILGLKESSFKPDNSLHRKILSYIRISKEFDLNNHNRGSGGFLLLVTYKYKELRGEYIPPVTYKDCKAKLEGLWRKNNG